MVAFLEINNIEIDVSNEVIEEVMVDIATDKLSTMRIF